MNNTNKALGGTRRILKPDFMSGRVLTKYLGIMTLLFLVLAGLRYYLKSICDPLDGFLTNVLDNLCAAVVVAACAAVAYYFVSPKISVEEDLSVVDAWNINTVLKRPLNTTKSYYYRGRSGRWIRSSAMPALVQSASRDSSLRDIHLILPDPRADDVMEDYAVYRNSLKLGDNWTASRIRNEILATIISCAKEASGNRFVNLHISLVTDFSVLRADLSDDGLVLTRENKQMPGWYSSANTKFYDSYLEDLRMIERRGRMIKASNHDFSQEPVSVGNVEQILVKIDTITQLDKSSPSEIIELVTKNENPYD